MHSPHEERKILVGTFLAAVAVLGIAIYVFRASVTPLAATSMSPANGAWRGPTPPRSGTENRPAPTTVPQVSAPDDQAAGSGIYRCEVGGQILYADTRCSQSPGHEIDAAVNDGFVSPTQGYIAADSPTRSAESMAVDSPRRVVMPTDDSDECRRINAAIVSNETDARQPHPGFYQDLLTRRKKELQARKYELSC
jgi:hypothetical protein